MSIISLILLLIPLTATPQDKEVPSTALSRPLALSNTSRYRPVQVIGPFDYRSLKTIGSLVNQLIVYETNGTDIGFDVYDTCSNPLSSLTHLVDALRNVGENKTDCTATPYLSVIGPTILTDMQCFLTTVKIPYFPLELTSVRDEIKAMSSVLLDLKGQSIAVFSTTKTLEDEMRLEAVGQNICIEFPVVSVADKRVQNPQCRVIEKTFIKLLAGVRKGGCLNDSREKNKTSKISDEKNQLFHKIEIWIHRLENISSAKELSKICVNILMKSGHGAFECIRLITSIAFNAEVAFLSVVVIIGLPAVADDAGFKRSGIQTPSFAALFQSIYFRGRISGVSGFIYSRLQAIGMRGFLSLREKLFVISVCYITILFYNVIVLFCNLFSLTILLEIALCGVLTLLLRKYIPKVLLVADMFFIGIILPQILFRCLVKLSSYAFN